MTKPNSKAETDSTAHAADVTEDNDEEQMKNSSSCHSDAVAAETRIANILRAAVIAVLLVTAAMVSAGVYVYTHNEERDNFHTRFRDDALQVIKTFHQLIERNIGASASMSTAITSYAREANLTFPFVTLPDFELRGSHQRIQSGSHVVHWAPLVTDENREEWEQYAMKNRAQIDRAYESDVYHRDKQDAEFGIDDSPNQNTTRQLDQLVEVNEGANLNDGTGYKAQIWRQKSPTDSSPEPEGEGPYLPAWQRSPIDPGKQQLLNMNWAKAKVIAGKPDLVNNMMRNHKAFLSHAAKPFPNVIHTLESNLRLSQYRERVKDLVDGLSTFLLYPVFDSFGDERKVGGVLLTNIYWKILFTNLLPVGSGAIICVVENSFNQTFTYRVEGSESFFIGMGDHHDPRYDELVQTRNVNSFIEQRKSPQNRAYTTVSLSDDHQYTIRVYPTKSTEDQFVTNKPAVYTTVVMVGFAFACVLFLLFSCVVERRQNIMMAKVVENAHRATLAERELNEFLSHEVRNPLSAAMSACSFVATAVNEANPLVDEEARKFVREDIEVVSSSLHFINDFLRSMLDIHRDKQIKIQLSPTDILRDIFEPVSSILYKRVATFDVIIDCPEHLMIMTDSVRLKQVVLNLVRNSSKFVEHGFLRMRADVVNHQVRIYVEDSGPGIPVEKRKELFAKYQESLDLLSQGTGIGLNLSKKLMRTLHGDLWLDDSYHSGIEGCPGASFVLDMKTPPLDFESTCQFADSKPVDDLDNSIHTRDIENQLVFESNFQAPVIIEAPISLDEINGSKLEQAPLSNKIKVEQPESLLPSGLSILFVDDDAVLRKLFVRALRKVEPSWTIQEASSGETALRLCENKTFDIIFMDQYMASIDKQFLGTETVQIMRSRGVESKICGLSANNLRNAFIDAGADEFILKPLPCKVAELRLALERLLSQKE